MTTRLLGRRLALLSLSILGFSSAAKAQSYCTPASTVGGGYFFAFTFGSPNWNNVSSPQTFNNQATNYTNNTGAGSAGTLPRFYSTQIHYAVFNPSSTITYPAANVRAYVDWNGDGDFSDAYENPYVQVFSHVPNGSYNDYATIAVPLNTPPGNYRLRYAYGQNGPASACGAFTGETEDFTISVGANTAPVFNPGSTPFLNNLLSTQTDNNGVSLDILIKDATGANLISDANDRAPNDRVPRGIAVTGSSASNGAWQYKIGSGAWTAFGAVSTTTALLISEAGLTPSDPTAPVRIRFVPTGPGNPSFTFRAWDLTTGTTSSYADASTTGGASAFSTAQQSVSITVLSPQSASLLPVYTIGFDTFMRSNGYEASTGILVHPQKLAANSAQHVGYDLRMNEAGDKLYWANEYSIYSAATDGTGLATVMSGTDYLMGFGLSATHLFYNGYDTVSYLPVLYRSAINGTNPVDLLDGPGQLPRADIGYFDKMNFYDNRLYAWMYSADYSTVCLVGMNTDGTGADTLYSSTTSSPSGLHIVADTAYWLEWVSPNTHVMSMALTGGASPAIVASTPIGLSTLVADPANRRILASSGSRMYSVNMTTGTTTRVLDLDGSPAAITAAISAGGGIPLSTPITAWSAAAAGSSAQLQWTVSAEPAGVQYVAERSADGSDFRPIGQVQGTGAGRYTMLDEAPLPGTNHYRLATTGRDGSRTLSAVRSVAFGATAAAVSIFPNPVGADGFTIQLPAGAALPQAYSILDGAGRAVGGGTLSRPATRISGAGLLPGRYIVQVQGQSFVLIRK